MRRLTILLATVGALLLLPVAQAFAGGIARVNIAGTGSGTVSSVGGLSQFSPEFPAEMEGEPPIQCSYTSPGPQTGTCENEMTFSEAFGFEGTFLKATAASGSEVVGWTRQEGPPIAFCPANQKQAEEQAEGGPYYCLAGEFAEGEAEVTVTINKCSEGSTQPTCEAPSGPELTITKEGTGSGTVVSNPAGIECGGTCSKSFAENTLVTLTASPSAGSTFVSWKGCDKGGVNGRECKVTMSAAKGVSAKFTLAYDVAVTKSGTGLGKVSSSPGGVLCLNNCSTTTAAFKEGTSVNLNAAPAKYNTFVEWTGACSGSGPCSLTMSANKSVGAKFAPVAQFGLSASKSGGGNGTVKSNLAGINCGATCSQMTANYYAGQEVELTAIPGKGSAFGGWSGACTGTGTCKVTMSAAKSAVAEFK